MEPTTWVEVSADALRENFRRVRDHAGVPVCAVVKANAYGHDLVEAARVLEGIDAPMLGVSRLEEARALRNAGIDSSLLLLTPPPDPRDAVTLRCAVTVGSEEDIGRLPMDARVHLKVDTGMGRLGVSPSDAVAAAQRVAERATLEAVWTHFADAAGADGRRQLERFLDVRRAIGRAGMTCSFHAASSAGMLALPDSRLDFVRVGTLLFGQNPPGATAPFPLRETFRWYARAVAVRTLAAGATVGYGGEWRARRPARVATIPIGWADGFGTEPLARTESLRDAMRAGGRVAAVAMRRRPSPRAVFFGDRRAPVLGRIGMQAVTVDVTGLDGIEPGSVARIPARRLLVSAAIERVYR